MQPIASTTSPAVAPSRRCFVRSAFFLLSSAALLALAAPAQNALGQAKKGEKVEIPAPQSLDLVTKDGLDLKATFYAGTKGKDSVPIVILHDYKGNRNEFHALATLLQSVGHAVLVPDLRGHGDSTRFRAFGNVRAVEIDAARMRRASDFADIVRFDLEAVRSYLLERNNAGELNLSKLCIIGSGMGATLALNWSLMDWSYPPLATGKQGQDIRALVLLSPEYSFKGLPVTNALAHPGVRSQISMLIFVGAENSRAAKDAQRIYNQLLPHHPEPPPERVRTDKSLFLQELATNLQGTQLITVQGFNVPATIAQFIQLRLVDKPFPWTER